MGMKDLSDGAGRGVGKKERVKNTGRDEGRREGGQGTGQKPEKRGVAAVRCPRTIVPRLIQRAAGHQFEKKEKKN